MTHSTRAEAVGRFRSRALSRRAVAFADVFRSPPLRRLELAWGSFFMVDALALVGLSVWAFRDRGTSAVGLLGLARLLPGAVALPFGAWAADRFPRRRIVAAVFTAMTCAQAGLAIALVADAPAVLVYVLVAVNSIAAAPYRPAHLALTPLVARSAEDLVAINVTAGTVEGLVTFLGPVLAAVLLTAGDPWIVLVAAAVAAAAGLSACSGVAVSTDPSRAVRGAGHRPLAALLGGIAELRANRAEASIVGCFVVQLLVRGLLNVLLIAVALDLLALGDSAIGWLAAAIGVGGIAGGLYAVSMTSRRRLGRPFAVALSLWGAPIALVGLAPNTAVAVLALFVIGVGNALLDVTGFTLIQRLGSDAMLGRVFGVLFTFGIAMGAVGSLLAPPLIDSLGLRTMLICTGALLPLLALLLLRMFASIDSNAETLPDVLVVLSEVPLLAPLPPTTLEKLAARAASRTVAEGETVVTRGDVADRFFVVAEGSVEVLLAGDARRRLDAGEHFGEIGLLRGMPRTATVTACAPTRLICIDGPQFVEALTGSPDAMATGMAVADERLRASPA